MLTKLPDHRKTRFTSVDFGIALLAIILISTFPQPMLAQVIDSGECNHIQDRDLKLDCFERLVSEAIAGETIPSTSDTAIAADANIYTQPATGQPGEIQEFGKQAPGPRLVKDSEGGTELIDYISALQQREPDRWLITLASGQVWYQLNSKRYRLREGMEIKIYPSPLKGSYRLSARNVNGFIQVERIR